MEVVRLNPKFPKSVAAVVRISKAVLASISKELNWKYFGFRDIKEESFYTSKYFKDPWFLWKFKALASLYWFLVYLLPILRYTKLKLSWIYLTNWGGISLQIYLLISFTVVNYGVKRRKIYSRVNIDDKQDNDSIRDLRWFHKLAMIVQTISRGSAIIITTIYWSLLEATISFHSLQKHLFNVVILALDLLVIDTPVRLLHFVYISVFALLYSLFSWSLHFRGINSAVYPIANWSVQPVKTTLLCIFMSTVGSLIVHVGVFLAYKSRQRYFESLSLTHV